MALVCPAKAASRRLKKLRTTWNHRLHNSDGDDDDDITSFKEIEKIKESNISTLKLLGSGGYSNVYLAREKSGRLFAIKLLKPSVCVNRKLLPICTADLAVETAILANLNHKNIIALHGIKKGNTASMFKNGSFFIAIDLLNETLKDRLERWRKGRWRFGNRSNSNSTDSLRYRLEDVALGIAKAMEYIHSKQLIYRDLKPENIGFDADGNVKIFDFGLARVGFWEDDNNSASESRNNSWRNMTTRVGTPKYMAPEVALGDTNYGFAVDVYSFSLILWQLVTNRNIFNQRKSTNALSVMIATKQMRPSLKCVSSGILKELIEQSWSNNPNDRPTFSAIRERLMYMIENPRLIYNNSGGRSASIMHSLQARKQKKEVRERLLFLRSKSNLSITGGDEETENEYDCCSMLTKEMSRQSIRTYNTSIS